MPNSTFAANRQQRGLTPPSPIAAGPVNLILFVAIIILSLAGLTATVMIAVLRPDTDNTALIATVVGFVAPATTTLLAFLIRDVHKDLNHRFTESLVNVGEAAFSAGKETERDAAGTAEGLAEVARESKTEISSLKDDAADLAVVARTSKTEIATSRAEILSLKEDAVNLAITARSSKLEIATLKDDAQVLAEIAHTTRQEALSLAEIARQARAEIASLREDAQHLLQTNAARVSEPAATETLKKDMP